MELLPWPNTRLSFPNVSDSLENVFCDVVLKIFDEKRKRFSEKFEKIFFIPFKQHVNTLFGLRSVVLEGAMTSASTTIPPMTFYLKRL